MPPHRRAAVIVALFFIPLLILAVWFGLVMADHAAWRHGAH